MSLTIGFWDGLSAKSRMGGFFLSLQLSAMLKALKIKVNQ